MRASFFSSSVGAFCLMRDRALSAELGGVWLDLDHATIPTGLLDCLEERDEDSSLCLI
jgi:hypothetical protein